MKTSIFGTPSIAIILLTSSAWANDIVHLTNSQMKNRADIVVTAGAEAGPHEVLDRGNKLFSYEFSVYAIEKGRPERHIVVIISGPLSEMNANCCRIGAKYKLYLYRRKDGAYASVDGRFGIVTLGGDGVVPLSSSCHPRSCR